MRHNSDAYLRGDIPSQGVPFEKRTLDMETLSFDKTDWPSLDFAVAFA
jgi:hypothetical protein